MVGKQKFVAAAGLLLGRVGADRPEVKNEDGTSQTKPGMSSLITFGDESSTGSYPSAVLDMHRRLVPNFNENSELTMLVPCKQSDDRNTWDVSAPGDHGYEEYGKGGLISKNENLPTEYEDKARELAKAAIGDGDASGANPYIVMKNELDGHFCLVPGMGEDGKDDVNDLQHVGSNFEDQKLYTDVSFFLIFRVTRGDIEKLSEVFGKAETAKAETATMYEAIQWQVYRKLNIGRSQTPANIYATKFLNSDELEEEFYIVFASNSKVGFEETVKQLKESYANKNTHAWVHPWSSLMEKVSD